MTEDFRAHQDPAISAGYQHEELAGLDDEESRPDGSVEDLAVPGFAPDDDNNAALSASNVIDDAPHKAKRDNARPILQGEAVSLTTETHGQGAPGGTPSMDALLADVLPSKDPKARRSIFGRRKESVSDLEVSGSQVVDFPSLGGLDAPASPAASAPFDLPPPAPEAFLDATSAQDGFGAAAAAAFGALPEPPADVDEYDFDEDALALGGFAPVVDAYGAAPELDAAPAVDAFAAPAEGFATPDPFAVVPEFSLEPDSEPEATGGFVAPDGLAPELSFGDNTGTPSELEAQAPDFPPPGMPAPAFGTAPAQFVDPTDWESAGQSALQSAVVEPDYIGYSPEAFSELPPPPVMIEDPQDVEAEVTTSAFSELSSLAGTRPKVERTRVGLTKRAAVEVQERKPLDDGSITPAARDADATRSRFSSFYSGTARAKVDAAEFEQKVHGGSSGEAMP